MLTPAPYLTGRLGRPGCRPPLPRRRLRRRALAAALLLSVALSVADAAGARAASVLYIRGGGSGHGIGMSQYGAYGYALHGLGYPAILAHYYTGTALGQVNPARIVRVLLATGTASFTGATAAASGGASGSPSETITLRATSTYTVGLAAGGRLQILGAGGAPVGPPVSATLTVTGAGPLQVPGLGAYRGSLQFRPDTRGGVETVDSVGLDDYLRGVVAEEMPSSWAAQALDAQAVAARTYAITTTLGASGYDLYSDTRSQMYGGVRAESTAGDAAVAATSGQVVTYGGRPVVTYFFTSSGGYTENIENVWTGSTPEPWLTGVPDPYDGGANDPYHRWTQQLSLAAASAKLGALVRGSLLGIAVTAHGASPRILQASVVGTRGVGPVTGAALQSIFGLATTDAAFITVSTTAAGGSLRASIFPASTAGSVWVQMLGAAGAWQNVHQLPLSVAASQARSVAAGSITATGLTPGRYRIVAGGLNGPTVTVF
ncbi:MAG: SpoIID/LytB domain-containing protein [Actinomycetota bacterium]|nr:SpoIID/LytB domain-containing protein [Actinomycetota bacterium]